MSEDSPQTFVEEDCPLCYERYTSPSSSLSSRSKIRCSAPSGCQTFHMCRLCVYRQATALSSPFAVEDHSGEDLCSIDPTTCPQCKRCGAFVDSMLPPICEGEKRREAQEMERRRAGIERRRAERMLRMLRVETGGIPLMVLRGGMLMNDGKVHPAIRQLSGFRNNVLAVSLDVDTLNFAEYSTVGVPDLYATSGVLYYEVVVTRHVAPGVPNFKCGFSLLNGMEISSGHTGVGVGETSRSWGFDSIGCKVHGEVFLDQRFVPNWYPGCVMGFAVNLDRGMIACSNNGSWNIIDRCGVKFEDEAIKSGVFPCLSARGVSLQFRYRQDTLKYSPPPMNLWDRWPKYQDFSWITIPEEARAAAMVMGYTSNSWAWSGNPIDHKRWDEMSHEEQAAGNVLGYNEEIWSQLTSLWKQDAQENPDSDSDDNMSFSCFSVMFWNDLPEDARQAAQTLGYSKTAWDEDSRIPLRVKLFAQLTQEQRRAAIILGYDSQTWNEHTESNFTLSESSADSCYSLPFDHLHWNDLPRHAREAAEVIGYTGDIWDHSEAGPLDDEPWAKLTEEEKMAAAILGYDENLWNESL
ncbi:hypothetical protein ACHAWX_002245 [Stephanocyclus meneghinianus]